MGRKALAVAAVLMAAACAAAEAKTVKLYGSDSLTVPEEWELRKASGGLPQQNAPIFMAGAKSGCGLRLDNAGAQKRSEFKATTAQYDDYLAQLLATAGLKIKSSQASSEKKISGYRALSKDFKLEIQGEDWGARVVQFNSKSRLYTAWILAPEEADEEKCFKEGGRILDSFRPKR
jgi:hypothetical protein